jgi:hypothetical protein
VLRTRRCGCDNCTTDHCRETTRQSRLLLLAHQWLLLRLTHV